MTAINYYPPGIVSHGMPCWCLTHELPAHVSSRTIDGYVHTRSWCQPLRPVPQVTP